MALPFPTTVEDAKKLINRVWQEPKDQGGLDWDRLVPFVWRLHQRNVATVAELGGGNNYSEFAFSADAQKLPARPQVDAICQLAE